MDLLPLQYLAYFPAAVFLGKIRATELVWGLCDRSGLGACSSWSPPRDVPPRRAALQRLWRISGDATSDPRYLRVFLTFARNSLVRDMTFRTNFLSDASRRSSWVLMNLGFYLISFTTRRMIGPDTGWGKYEFFLFLATTCWSTAWCRPSS